MYILGITIPIEANVAVAICILPLNSALNPFLYTLNVLRDKLGAREEARLLKKVEKTLAVEYTTTWIKDQTILPNDLGL